MEEVTEVLIGKKALIYLAKGQMVQKSILF